MRKSKLSVRSQNNFGKQSMSLILVAINYACLQEKRMAIRLLHHSYGRNGKAAGKCNKESLPQKGISIINCKLESLQLKNEFLRRCRRQLNT